MKKTREQQPKNKEKDEPLVTDNLTVPPELDAKILDEMASDLNIPGTVKVPFIRRADETTTQLTKRLEAFKTRIGKGEFETGPLRVTKPGWFFQQRGPNGYVLRVAYPTNETNEELSHES